MAIDVAIAHSTVECFAVGVPHPRPAVERYHVADLHVFLHSGNRRRVQHMVIGKQQNPIARGGSASHVALVQGIPHAVMGNAGNFEIAIVRARLELAHNDNFGDERVGERLWECEATQQIRTERMRLLAGTERSERRVAERTGRDDETDAHTGNIPSPPKLQPGTCKWLTSLTAPSGAITSQMSGSWTPRTSWNNINPPARMSGRNADRKSTR